MDRTAALEHEGIVLWERFEEGEAQDTREGGARHPKADPDGQEADDRKSSESAWKHTIRSPDIRRFAPGGL
jgi:hypothetical protein